MPLLSKQFWTQNNSETQTGSPTMICGDVRQKSSTKLWYPYYRKSFDTRRFLKDRKVRPRCFSAIWDKKISTEKRDTPFLSFFFRTRKFLKHKSVLHEVFRYRETKTFRRKVAEFLFYAKSFWMTQFLWIFEGFPTKNSAPWDKEVQKSRDSLLCKIFSIPKDFWSTRVLLRNFLVLWDKNDQQNCDTPII